VINGVLAFVVDEQRNAGLVALVDVAIEPVARGYHFINFLLHLVHEGLSSCE
jgi:hypothetical protein